MQSIDMQAVRAHSAYMKKGIQYTIRNVPEKVDEVLRRLAVREGESLNASALAALKAGAGVAENAVRHHDLDMLAGSWVQDDRFDQAQKAFESIDADLWK